MPTSVRIWIFRYLPVLPPCLKRSVCISRQPMPPSGFVPLPEPSVRFGKADAVMIVCSDVILADTYATAFANTIQTAEDVQTCIEKIREQEDILAAIAIKDDKLGICGNFELKLF